MRVFHSGRLSDNGTLFRAGKSYFHPEFPAAKTLKKAKKHKKNVFFAICRLTIQLLRLYYVAYQNKSGGLAQLVRASES